LLVEGGPPLAAFFFFFFPVGGVCFSFSPGTKKKVSPTSQFFGCGPGRILGGSKGGVWVLL